MDTSNLNLRAPSVRRILQELRELEKDDNPDVLAQANDDNIFEWHFAIRGAWDTEFEGGIYHGRIIMPAEYPFKPPAFVMLTPSGRFETNVKICLSISSHHPESWQPSWSVRSALVALIAFMQSPGHGALGSLDQPKELRQQLATASREKPPTYGSEARQKVINEMHQRMLEMEPRSRQQYSPEAPAPAAPATPEGAEAPAREGELPQPQQLQTGERGPGESPAASPGAEPVPAAGAAAGGGPGVRQRRGAADAAAAPPAPRRAAQGPAAAQQPAHLHASFEDRLLTWLAVLLVAGILALVARRLFGAGLLGDAGRAGHALPDTQL